MEIFMRFDWHYSVTYFSSFYRGRSKTTLKFLGEYVCKAKNELGEDIVRCKLVCKELPAIQMENQVPKGMKKSEYMMQMEASMKKYAQEIMLTEDDVYDIGKSNFLGQNINTRWQLLT